MSNDRKTGISIDIDVWEKVATEGATASYCANLAQALVDVLAKAGLEGDVSVTYKTVGYADNYVEEADDEA